MPQRDEHRLDAYPGAQHRTDRLAAMAQRRPLTAPRGHLVVHAAQPRLGHADGRQVEPQPQVRGHAETTRMGDALAVHHHQLGPCGDPVEGRQRRGNLAKGEQPRNVGHAGRLAMHHLLHHLEADHGVAGPGQHHHRCPGDLAVLLEADVDPGDMTHR